MIKRVNKNFKSTKVFIRFSFHTENFEKWTMNKISIRGDEKNTLDQ